MLSLVVGSPEVGNANSAQDDSHGLKWTGAAFAGPKPGVSRVGSLMLRYGVWSPKLAVVQD